jgi:putative salt-induced outer membrane protein YdiY
MLAFLALCALNTAVAQWPTDEHLAAPQTVQLPTATEQLPSVAPMESLAPSTFGAIGELAAGQTSDSWVLPTYWISAVDWDGGVEVGINGTDGNAQTTSVRAGVNLGRKTEFQETKFDLTYLKATAEGVKTQHNIIQNFGYERSFGDSRWSFFAKEFMEYDEFKAFDLRLALNSGLAFKFIDTEITTLKGRYGAGVSREFGGPSDDWVPELVYGVDFKRQLTKRQKLALTVDYFPEWRNFDNYRMVTDLGWEVLLDEEHNLNLKLSVNDRYDSTPNGRKPNDINYALLLLWKL